MNLFQDMLQKTKRHTLVLDPIRDEPSDFLNELVNSASIQEPENVFQFSITDKSKTVVHDQIRKYQLSIMSAVNRSEYLLIKYQLDQMKRLNNLLEQDYIEQIYSDCIRHLSKHLVEEYQQAISLLNRCLIHQTVLTDSDIEQYQTYIDHAASAEILRKDHLESESVHSSAFIQYLNQQLDEIKGDLSTKEIDDLSVKTNLDKIKLLTKYFPQINDMYKNLCQLFMEKIHLKVNLFDSLVLNNQFEECATIMENLAVH
ncbi:hypothetical protein I4U23_004499 [Adineta vaga]|nr:hypothetical protein I4U23_004499 [Adineta vaga]